MKRCLAVLGLMLLTCLARAADAPTVGLLELYNYYEYSPALLSAGQPTREQFPAIAKAGVEAVINLAPVTDPGALADEAEVVGKLGMGYVHIPVDWDKPPRADVESFLAAMERFKGKRMLVHCYAGSRASAFVYMYRVLEQKADRADARVTLEKIWANNPGYELPVVPQWRQLIDEVLAAHSS
ncbi:MAG: protein tyrosine phosphatase family protein [Proteobacteria bacterium]|nr:protein tyrosine phosphatase family protein [Pseudomonadota bacterium]